MTSDCSSATDAETDLTDTDSSAVEPTEPVVNRGLQTFRAGAGQPLLVIPNSEASPPSDKPND